MAHCGLVILKSLYFGDCKGFKSYAICLNFTSFDLITIGEAMKESYVIGAHYRGECYFLGLVKHNGTTFD